MNSFIMNFLDNSYIHVFFVFEVWSLISWVIHCRQYFFIIFNLSGNDRLLNNDHINILIQLFSYKSFRNSPKNKLILIQVVTIYIPFENSIAFMSKWSVPKSVSVFCKSAQYFDLSSVLSSCVGLPESCICFQNETKGFFYAQDKVHWILWLLSLFIPSCHHNGNLFIPISAKKWIH